MLFRSNHGCKLQLIELVADDTNALDQGDKIEACVLDFSKAFDKVHHLKLLYKLANYGVNFKLVSWIEDFLTGRTQKVVVEGEKSESAPVTSDRKSTRLNSSHVKRSRMPSSA